MESAVFDPDRNLELFQELLGCGAAVYLWSYANDGHLVHTNCPELVLDVIFDNIGCKAYTLEYGKENTAPLVLGGPLGLMWCAAFEQKNGRLHRMHVIGPVFNTESSLRGLQESFQDHQIPMGFQPRLRELMLALPIVATTLFFQHGLMLHYCVTGEKLMRSDIQFQEGEARGSGQKKKLQPKDRHQTYAAEQTLMWMVREGNLNYQSALAQAGRLSSGVQINSGKPMEQAVISCAVFTSLCVRAAIQGGLSPDVAYALGDSYIQSMIQCRTVSELTSINHEMYVDFVQRVHKHRIDPGISGQVQACRDYIELHLEEDIQLKTLADLTGYTEYYLSRKFQKETGVSIGDHVKFARVERAKLLLTTTGQPVSQIAKQFRFCSSSYFCRIFRQVTGLTPQQWRDQARGDRPVNSGAGTKGRSPS